MCMTQYTSDTGTLSFWLLLYDSWPTYQRQSTDIPPTINGQRIGRVSGTISTKISADSQSIRWPTLGQCLSCYIGQYIDWHILVDISAEWQSICRPTYRLSVSRYVDRYIGRVSVNMSTDTSVEGCTNYTWSNFFSGFNFTTA